MQKNLLEFLTNKNMFWVVGAYAPGIRIKFFFVHLVINYLDLGL